MLFVGINKRCNWDNQLYKYLVIKDPNDSLETPKISVEIPRPTNIPLSSALVKKNALAKNLDIFAFKNGKIA